mmetsp:Transcript_48148/g.140313  ORF Transcript_48148/g.140313 Transcript_48148/m.140313 type:complete len:285 (-) Transcript_48148:738-1592(-)
MSRPLQSAGVFGGKPLKVASEHRMLTPYSLQRPSKRLAVLTGSPMQPNFIFTSLPMLPLRTSPVCRPMRIISSGKSHPSCAKSWLRSASSRCCAKAAKQALPQWSSTSPGAFQYTSNPSPRISATTPSCRSTTCVMALKYRVRSLRRSCSHKLSEMAVKSLMSENMIVTRRRKTCKCLAPGSSRTMLWTTESGTNLAKASMALESRQNESCRLPTSLIRDRVPRRNCSNSLESRAKSRSPSLRMRFASMPRRLETRKLSAIATAMHDTNAATKMPTPARRASSM